MQTKFLTDYRQRNALSQLETSFDVRKTIHRIRKHRLQKTDILLAIQLAVFIFCFSIMTNPPILGKFIIASLLIIAISIPITSQFFFNALPIFTWLILFFSCQFIPHEWRPKIYVRVLPALETILYGGNLSDVLASHTNNILDILAWIPYGLVHFGAPFVLAAVLFVFAPPKTLPCYALAFGWMNFIGVTIQILFPCAPPWYQNLYGLQPANYSMPGSPGGLARVDQILGLDMYTSSFTASPQVFGAFPSLHSGCAVMEALFCCYLFPKYSYVFIGYVFWIWWSTMYLTHHYFVDLIGGAILSFVVFYAVKRTCLPRILPDHFSRWSYDTIETGEEQPVKYRKSIDGGFELPLYNQSGESKFSFDRPSVESAPSSSHARMASLPTLDTNPSNGTNPLSSASIKKLQSSHNKSSSYNLYDSEVYATSASNSNNNITGITHSALSTGGTTPSSVISSSNTSASVTTPISAPSSPTLPSSNASIWSLSRPSSTSPVDDGKKSARFNRAGSPPHRD